MAYYVCQKPMTFELEGETFMLSKRSKELYLHNSYKFKADRFVSIAKNSGLGIVETQYDEDKGRSPPFQDCIVARLLPFISSDWFFSQGISVFLTLMTSIQRVFQMRGIMLLDHFPARYGNFLRFDRCPRLPANAYKYLRMA